MGATKFPKSKPTPSKVTEFAKQCKENIGISNINCLIFFTCFSFLCYVGDIVWDIYLLIYFWNKKDDWNFWFTLVFVVVPIVVITFKSFLFYNNEFEKTDSKSDPRPYLTGKEYGTFSNWAIKWVLGFVGLCLIPRYWDTIKYARKAKQAKVNDDASKNNNFSAMIWEDAELLQLCQFGSFMASAPQLLLNLYILVKGESDLEGYTAIGLLFPIISLSWAIVSYDKKCCLVKGTEPDEGNRILIDDAIDCYTKFNGKKIAILLSAHFFWIIARVMALSLFSFVQGWLIWPASLVHLISIFVWHLETNYNVMDSLRLSFLHVFAYLHPLEKKSDQAKHPRFPPGTYQSVCICENLFLMVMWSQSLIKCDEGINPGILSISYYPWSDWTFFVPWIGQILTFIFSLMLFRLQKERQSFSPVTPPVIDIAQYCHAGGRLRRLTDALPSGTAPPVEQKVSPGVTPLVIPPITPSI